ncbi:MAG: hypothetical protein KDA57_22235, partial [Planctomycetales bacterium]|nr:hypothetical protein [Planctomycetales bacterium]
MAAKDKALWLEALERFDGWWLHVTEYANFEGDHELPQDFYELDDGVQSFIRERTELDETPFFEIGGLVKRLAGIVCRDPEFPRKP